MMTIHEILVNRHSTRKFKTEKIETEKIELLKQAVLLSPTGKSKNHWEFIFIENEATLKLLSQCRPYGSKLLEGAALAVVVIGSPEQSDTWIEDCSIASILLQMQAEELGLSSCWVQIDKRLNSESLSANEFVKEHLNIPASKNVLSIVALGYATEKKAPKNESELLYDRIHQEKF